MNYLSKVLMTVVVFMVIFAVSRLDPERRRVPLRRFLLFSTGCISPVWTAITAWRVVNFTVHDNAFYRTLLLAFLLTTTIATGIVFSDKKTRWSVLKLAIGTAISFVNGIIHVVELVASAIGYLLQTLRRDSNEEYYQGPDEEQNYQDDGHRRWRESGSYDGWTHYDYQDDYSYRDHSDSSSREHSRYEQAPVTMSRAKARLVLGVDISATPDDIKTAWRKMVIAYHPDTYNGADAHEMTCLINEAYEVLTA